MTRLIIAIAAAFGAALFAASPSAAPAGAADPYKSCVQLAPPSVQICSRALNLRGLNERHREIALTTRGMLNSSFGDWPASLADFNAVIRKGTSFYEAYYGRAQVHLHQGRAKEALADLNRAMLLPARPKSDGALFGEKHDTIYYERARAHRKLGDVDAAIRDYSTYLARQQNTSANFERAELLVLKGEWRSALADFSVAVQANPNWFEPLQRRAETYVAAGDLSAALADYRLLEQRSAGTWTKEIIALEAAIRSGRLAQSQPASPGPVRKQDRSDCLESFGGGDSDTAIPACTRLLASPAVKNDERVKVLVMRGTWYMSASQPDPAIADFREAAQQSPTRDALFGLAEAYRTKGDFDKAIAAISDYVAAHRDDPEGYHIRANLHASNRDFDSAIADMTAKIRVGARDHGDYVLRASFWREKGDLDRAVADYSEALRIAPRNQSAYELRARVYEEMDDMPRALADFRKALSLDPEIGKSMGIDKKIARLERDIASGFRADTKVAKENRATGEQTALAPVGENRIALVIGNSAYRHNAPLANPKADAEALATTLKRVGFKSVDLKLDLGREQLIDALRSFAGDAAQADWAVIYFAGHGLQIGGINYLVPVDARLASDRDVSFEAVAMDHVLNAVEGARKLRLAILDACRDNPFVKTMTRSLATRSLGRGLAAVEPHRSTLVAFAARDGQVALDGAGSNSPFVSALIRHLETPGLEINLLFRKVRDEVLKLTGNDQEPFTYGSLSSEALYFRPVTGAR